MMRNRWDEAAVGFALIDEHGNPTSVSVGSNVMFRPQRVQKQIKVQHVRKAEHYRNM